MTLVRAQTLALDLMRLHGLLDEDWQFEFDFFEREKDREANLGATWFEPKVITLSSLHAKYNSDAEIKNTILHEIAHALTGLEGEHDFEWYDKAVTIGGDGT